MGVSAINRILKTIKLEHVIAVVAIVVTITLATAIVRYFEFVQALGGYGYLGVLIISVIAGGTILVPIPALIVVFAMGGVPTSLGIFNPAIVGAVAGLGEGIGAMLIYATGMGGSSLFQNRFPKVYSRVLGWAQRRGSWAVFFHSAIFNPLYYPLTLAAGALRFGFWRFYFLTWAGKTVKGMIVAYAGYLGLRGLINFIG